MRSLRSWRARAEVWGSVSGAGHWEGCDGCRCPALVLACILSGMGYWGTEPGKMGVLQPRDAGGTTLLQIPQEHQVWDLLPALLTGDPHGSRWGRVPHSIPRRWLHLRAPRPPPVWGTLWGVAGRYGPAPPSLPPCHPLTAFTAPFKSFPSLT